MTNERTSFFEWSDARLAAEIEKIRAANVHGDQMVLLQVFTNERQSRTIRREARREAASVRRISRVALAISVLSVIGSVGVTTYFSRQAAQSSERWEKAQITLLQAFRDEAAAARRDLEKLQEVAASVQREMAARRGSAPAKPRR